MSDHTLAFTSPGFLGAIKKEPLPAPLPGAVWYKAEGDGDGLLFTFKPGALAQYQFLSADFLLDGDHLVVLILELQEGDFGATFGFSFGLLNQCSARMRMPLDAVHQNRWRYPREGAFLKPRCTGERVDLQKVDRIALRIERKSRLPARWCMTPLLAVQGEPPLLEALVLPKGPLLDELGQSAIHQWSTRTRSIAEVTERLHSQLARASQHPWPADFSRWGGWTGKRFEASGYFRTYHDGGRWWLVDPDGHPFWSAGMDCVRVDTTAAIEGLESALAWLPDESGEFAPAFRERGEVRLFNYLAANFIRAFGVESWVENWAQIALGELRRAGFNTVANWSDWEFASQNGMPYVRPLPNTYEQLPCIYRDFPDVFHPDFPAAAAAFAEPLKTSAGDPAFIGYFLMNEPTWGFASETPAAGMLFNTPQCQTRRALADFLRRRYASDAGLSSAWGLPATLSQVAEGEWRHSLTPIAASDLADFSAVMVEKFFGGLSAACRAVDPHHLNLGIRYYTIPPPWALEGMRHFDVFSMNCYKKRLPAVDMAQVSALLNQPILIGEWHFGALDAGLPASGIGHVPSQEERGKAFRVYVEDAASRPWCVGAHYFILYDQSAIGRFDGENYNIGFLDVCNRPYEALCAAARQTHERLYAVACGQSEPFADEPHYLPLLFM
jgi:hypothetical protein